MAGSHILTIDVFHAEPPTFQSHAPGRVQFVATFDLDALPADEQDDDDPDAMWAMDLAFRFTNSIDVPWWGAGVPGLTPAGTRLRSTSVGDVFRARWDDGIERCWPRSASASSEPARLRTSSSSPRCRPSSPTALRLESRTMDASDGPPGCTPGEWRARHGSDGREGVYGGDGNLVCGVYGGILNDPVRISADAGLIAAAPAMYAALHSVYEIVRKAALAGEPGAKDAFSILTKAMDKARKPLRMHPWTAIEGRP